MARLFDTQADALLREGLRGEGRLRNLPNQDMGPQGFLGRPGTGGLDPRFEQAALMRSLVARLRMPRPKNRPVKAAEMLGTLFRNM